jgi:hypothetical protein
MPKPARTGFGVNRALGLRAQAGPARKADGESPALVVDRFNKRETF